MKKSKKILIIGLTGLGNLVLKIPLFKTIKFSDTNYELHILVNKKYNYNKFLDELGIVNKIHILNDEENSHYQLRQILLLKKYKFDYILLPFDSSTKLTIFGSLFFKSTKIMHINLDVSYLRKIRNSIFYLFFKNYKFVPFMPGRHEIDLNIDLFESLINSPLKRSFNTEFKFKNDQNSIKQFNLLKYKYICIQISSAHGDYNAKTWNPKNFKELIRKILYKYNDFQVVILGDKHDTNYYQDEKINSKNLINLIGKTDLNELLNVIYYSSAVIACDSSIGHLANALKVNLISLFGPTDYTRTVPKGENTKVIYTDDQYTGIMYNFRYLEKDLSKTNHNFKLMSGITTNKVFSELEKILIHTHKD